MTDKPAPNWKFWHPLPFWQVLIIFLVIGLAANFSIVALREMAGVNLPQWIAGGLGGLLSVIAVQQLAKRRLARP